MKNMILISTLFALFNACDKPDEQTIEGVWALTATELYKDKILTGSTVEDEISTFYEFREKFSCQTIDNKLIIRSDGEEHVYNYDHFAHEKRLVLNDGSCFIIEELTSSRLVLYKEYTPYRSRYTFYKVE
jgi:hypothetical protein